jgi:hypothetical protein
MPRKTEEIDSRRLVATLRKLLWIDEDFLHPRFSIADVTLDSSDCGLDLLNVEGTTESNFHGEDCLLRADLHREQLTHALDSRIAGNDLSHAANARAISPFTDKECARFPT